MNPNISITSLIICSFFIDIFNLANYGQGRGFCFIFSTPGPEFCIEKLFRGSEFEQLMGKISGMGEGGGGGEW